MIRVARLINAVRALPIATAAPAQLFGHPRGLTFLFTTEMWERFSYYGMRSLLVLYMTKFLLLSDHSGNVIGLGALQRGSECWFGPLEVQLLLSQTWGLYTGLVYFTPIFGGLLADRVLGQRRTVVVGATLMAIGHFMMAVEQLFLFALLALILGSGCFKPNISTQVGGLYGASDPRRDRAYSIFYVGINLGAFLSPLVCGSLGENAGWHYGFAAAGVGMLIALAVYVGGFKTLPEDELTRNRADHAAKPVLTGEQRHAVLWLILLILPLMLYWACNEQQGNTIALWASDNTDRSINLFFWRGEIDVTWFQSINPLII